MTNSVSKQKYTTVGELIEILQRHDPDKVVVVTVDVGEDVTFIRHPLFNAKNGSFNPHPGENSHRSCLRLTITDGENL